MRLSRAWLNQEDQCKAICSALNEKQERGRARFCSNDAFNHCVWRIAEAKRQVWRDEFHDSSMFVSNYVASPFDVANFLMLKKDKSICHGTSVAKRAAR